MERDVGRYPGEALDLHVQDDGGLALLYGHLDAHVLFARRKTRPARTRTL